MRRNPSHHMGQNPFCPNIVSLDQEDNNMAKEAKVWEIIRNAGYEPIENRSIVVSYAPENLSEAIVKFLGVSTEFFVLQICRDELVLVPFGKLAWGLKKDVTLSLPFSEIKDIEVKKAGLNDYLTIRTEKDVITLSVQQKELSFLRSSGILGGSWHSKNMDETIKMLQELAEAQV